MADFIIENFCKGNPRYKQYLINLNAKKEEFRKKVENDMSLFSTN